MSDSTRRGFLKIAGTGAAAVSAAAVVPGVVGRHGRAATDIALPAGAEGSLMAHVDDLQKGQVTVMVEGREVTVTDHQLVARLAHALHTARTDTAVQA